MDLDKLSAKSRVLLGFISFVGLILVIAGAISAGVIMDHGIMPVTNGGPSGDLISAFISAGPMFVCTALGILLLVLPWAVWPVVNILTRRGVDSRYRAEQMMGALEVHRQLLESLKDTISLSDAAKQLAYRSKDLDALRIAIRDDIDKGDFEAATNLANEMERRFGYASEANQWRDKISDRSKAAIENRIAETSMHVDEMLQKFEWMEASREAEAIARQFPNHPVASRLPERIYIAKDMRKRELLKQWKDATARDDVDESVSLLRNLDQYLTPSEAEAYKENARDIFRKKLQQLGVQFALYVHDKNWTEAYRIGRQITEEFPNTQMAREVRDRLPVLQERAQAPAGTPGAPVAPIALPTPVGAA